MVAVAQLVRAHGPESRDAARFDPCQPRFGVIPARWSSGRTLRSILAYQIVTGGVAEHERSPLGISIGGCKCG